MKTVVNFLLVLLALVGFVGLTPVAGSDINALVDASLLHCNYHGPLLVGARPTPVLLHVLVKAKTQADGTFLLRTVSYIEKVDYEGNSDFLDGSSANGRATAESHKTWLRTCADGQDFSPIPDKVEIFVEHQDANGTWQPIHLTQLGNVLAYGPFVHESKMPSSMASKELRLRVLDWPVFYGINLLHLARQSFHGPLYKSAGAHSNAVVIGDVQMQNSSAAAQYLATHMLHHFALGFDLYLVYVRGAALIEALVSNSVTAGLLAEQKLLIVPLDLLQIPWYDDGSDYQDMLDHVHQRKVAAYDSVKLVAYNHAALMLWGERYHLAALDLDEMWSSRDASTSVNTWFQHDTCFPDSDVLQASRVNMLCRECLSNGVSELQFFQQNWDASNPTEVLRHFSTVVGFNKDPKSVFDIDKVGQVWLHRPFVPSSSKVAEVKMYDNGTVLTQECAFVVHLRNMFGRRTDDLSTASDQPHWLVHHHRAAQ